MNEPISKRRQDTTARPQLVNPTSNSGRATSVVGLNQHVKKSVYRLVFKSELRISSLRQVAKLVGLSGPRSEAKVLDALREMVREAMRPPTPPAHETQMWTRRAA